MYTSSNILHKLLIRPAGLSIGHVDTPSALNSKPKSKTTLNQLWAFLTIIAGIGASCSQSPKPEQVVQLERERDSLEIVIEQRDSLMDEVMGAFYQIEKDLAFIREERNLISIKSENPEIEESKKEKIVKDVKELADLLRESKKKLALLDKELQKSGVKIKNLEARIADLTMSADERVLEITTLKEELEKKDYEVAVLNEHVEALEVENEMHKVIIADQEKKINDYNTAFYTLGTNKELEQKGVVQKKGGFLGLGRTTTLSTNIKLDYFSEYDIRAMKSIEIKSEDAKLISEHPSGSYEFVHENDQIGYLAINNINEFYKFSKYIVLEVK